MLLFRTSLRYHNHFLIFDDQFTEFRLISSILGVHTRFTSNILSLLQCTEARVVDKQPWTNCWANCNSLCHPWRISITTVAFYNKFVKNFKFYHSHSQTHRHKSHKFLLIIFWWPIHNYESVRADRSKYSKKGFTESFANGR